MAGHKHKPISPENLEKFNEFIAHHIGLHFKPGRLPELERGIRKASQEFGFHDPDACIQWIISSSIPLSKKQMEILSIHLTVGETYFFRENEAFTVLNNYVLPRLIESAAGKLADGLPHRLLSFPGQWIFPTVTPKRLSL